MNEKVITNLGNKEIFIRNVKRNLANSGSKQIDVCRAIGVSTGTFSDWMKGRSYPRMDKIQLLAEYFGVKKSDLVEDVNVPKNAVSEEDQKVLDLLHKIPQDKREAAIEMCEAVLKNLSKF